MAARPLNPSFYMGSDTVRTVGMARIRVLTALKVKQDLKPGMYADGLGLYLKVRPGNSKSWIFRYRVGRKLRDMGLGPFHTVSLAEAREKAEVCRALRIRGLDPLDERRKEYQAQSAEPAKIITFEVCAEAYITTHRAGWKNGKHAEQWTATLQTYAYPIFDDTPVAKIDDTLVLKVLQPIWGTKTETASRLRGRIERILDWARVMKYRTGENPARWRGHLDHLLPKRSRVAAVVHHAALSIDETPTFIQVLREQQTVVARAFEFCILTATRTNETMGMRWDEYDAVDQVWIVPSARMKAGRDHRVALATRARQILAEMRKIRMSDFVFPGGAEERPLSSMAFLMLLRRLGHGAVTAHGFRSTFRDWAAERTNFPNEVVEMALAHTIGNKVEAAYRRGDLLEKRRELAEAWAAFCSGV